MLFVIRLVTLPTVGSEQPSYVKASIKLYVRFGNVATRISISVLLRQCIAHPPSLQIHSLVSGYVYSFYIHNFVPLTQHLITDNFQNIIQFCFFLKVALTGATGTRFLAH
jgi:hypothetical protein